MLRRLWSENWLDWEIFTFQNHSARFFFSTFDLRTRLGGKSPEVKEVKEVKEVAL